MALVEAYVQEFATQMLRRAHALTEQYQYIVRNLFAVLLLALVVAATAYFSYQGMPSPDELRKREQARREIILAKIREVDQRRSPDKENWFT